MSRKKRRYFALLSMLLGAVAAILIGVVDISGIRSYEKVYTKLTQSTASAPKTETKDLKKQDKAKPDNNIAEIKNKITIVIGDKKEVLTPDIISGWIISKKDDKNKAVLECDSEKISDYVNDLADKYDTFQEYFNFTTVNGDDVVLKNEGSGWIMDRDYAQAAISRMILSGKDVQIDITDKSQESKKWWVRIAGDYDPDIAGSDSYAEVSIEDQYMWLYIDGKMVLESPVVTGNPNLGNDTPVGAYIVTDKIRNATLYDTTYQTEVDYWVGFTYQIGFHDAQWQDNFGGDEYFENGSHGCVNLPTDAAAIVFEKAYVSMPVFVY